MAITGPTAIRTYANLNNTNPYATNGTGAGHVGGGTDALVAGRLYIVHITSYSSGAAEVPTSVVFDSGGADQLTFAKLTDGTDVAEQTGYGVTGQSHAVWYAFATANTAASFWTVNFGATQSACEIAVAEYSGVATGGGATTFPQLVLNTGLGTSASVTMATFGATDNVALLFVARDDHNTSFSPDESRSESYDYTDAERTTMCLHYQNPHGGDTSLTATLSTSDDWAAFGVELAAASTGTTVTPSAVSAAFSIAAPSLIKGARTLTPNAVTAVWTTTTPQLLKVNVLTPAAVTAAWSVFTPAIVKGVRTLTPASVTAAWSVFTPTLVKGALTLTPAPVSAVWGVFTPTVFQGVTITPNAVTATFTIATPTVVRGARILTPSAVTATWAVFTPTVVAGGQPQTLTPSPVTASWSVFTPTVVRGAKVLTPTTITAAWTVIAPTVVRGARILTPTPVTAAWSVTTPSLIKGTRVLTPTPVTAFWSVFTPFVDTGGAPAVYLGPHGRGQRGGWRRRG